MALRFSPPRGVFRVLLVSLLILGACAPVREHEGDDEAAQDFKPLAECPDVPRDQKESFAKRRSKFPFQISLDSHFTAAEVNLIQQSVSAWNQVSQARYHQNFFEIVSHSAPLADIHNIINCSYPNNPNELFIFRIESPHRWRSLGHTDFQLGVTHHCFMMARGAQGVSKVTGTTIVIGHQAIGAKFHQFKSIILHELGHAVGLDHSCSENGAKPGHLSCIGINRPHEYRLASMFPTLEPRETREDLNRNDQTRGGCTARRTWSNSH